jgi:hypothetical protein
MVGLMSHFSEAKLESSLYDVVLPLNVEPTKLNGISHK